MPELVRKKFLNSHVGDLHSTCSRVFQIKIFQSVILWGKSVHTKILQRDKTKCRIVGKHGPFSWFRWRLSQRTLDVS